MKRRRIPGSKTDWQVTITAAMIGVAFLYAGFDRLAYCRQAHARELLRSQSTEAWRAFFDAQGEVQRHAARPLNAAADSLALTTDPVLSAHMVLEYWANATGVHILAMTPATPTTDAGVTKTPVSLSLEGSYPHIVKFLGHLEASPLLFQLIGASVSASDNPNQRISGSASLLVVTVPSSGGTRS